MDIRTAIGGLLAIYGIILTIAGLVMDADARANVWAGICLLVAGAAFLVWVKARPTKLPEAAQTTDAGQPEKS
ncbi:hypothetical protein [Cutibacterium sp.]|uniref:hypothetical protein n=1 Tax=Cutibacterium sp. TaxID=1912221 RepID=UPI0026DC8EB9|nr:hypothetical protein [Cutibacterium sp.]MDO4412435.1 hypothetical protein [Cutibacterium sp.]